MKLLYNLTRHINEPTRGNKVLDHIISNSPSQIKHCGVIPCPQISDHDSPYIIFHTKSRVDEPRYKYIRSMKTFDKKIFVNGFSNLPFSVIDGVDEPEGKLEIFDALITQYLQDHAPLKRIKIRSAPAPWMKDLDIVSLQNQCREWRHKCHQPNNSETDWEKFRYYRNKLKKTIKTTKKQFYRKALQSKKPKEVWSIIHRILSPNQKKITSSPEKLNSYYVNLAETLTGKQSATPTELNEIINNLPSTNKDSFMLKTVTY